MRTDRNGWIAWVAVATIVCGGTVQAASRSWINTSGGTWDDSTTANWSGSAVPVAGDEVRITNNAAGDYTVDFASANFSGLNYLHQLIMGNNGGGTVTLQLGSGDTLQYTGTTAHAGVTLNAGSKMIFDSGAFMTSTTNNYVNFTVAGGSVVMHGGLLVQPANASPSSVHIDNGSWIQDGGTVSTTGSTYLADSAGQVATLHISGGVFSNQWYDLLSSAGSGTLILTNTGSLYVKRDVIFNKTGGMGSIQLYSGPFQFTSGNGQSSLGGAGTTTVSVAGANWLNTGAIAIRTNATVTISSGLFSNGTLNVDSGTLLMNGGRVWTVNQLRVGYVPDGTPGRITATEGFFRSREFRIATNANSSGTLTIGSNVWWETGSLTTTSDQVPRIGALGGTGTALLEVLGVTNVANSGFSYVTINKTGVVRGYGRLNGVLSTFFTMNGRVIADGYGVDRTLDLMTQPFLSNSVDNALGENRGWYAQNHGKLALRGTNVAAGACTRLWGEGVDDADGIPDLVNSVKFDFTGITGGALTNVLLAADRGDVPKGLYKAIGVWESSGVNLGSGNVSLTIRYDDASATAQSAPQNLLAIWRYDGTAWRKVPSSVDTGNKLISTTTPLTALGKFAVAPLVKGTMMEVF